MNISVDIEGLGKNSDRGAVLAIGACTFDQHGVHTRMYVAIDLLDSVLNGFTIDPDTVAWWRKQPEEAVAHVRKGIHVKDALHKFRSFLHRDDLIWAKGPDYDLVMLTTAYEMMDIRCPFSFRNARCVRTRLALGRSLGLTDVDRKGTKHFALDDAVYQAEQIIKVTNHVQQLTTKMTDKGMEYINLW